PIGKQYAFRGEKEGYYPVSEYLDVRELSAYQEIKEDLHMAPLEVGQTIRINNIFFELDKSELRQESFEELNLLVRILENNPDIRIELGGHTDSQGSDSYNLQLSTDRAASVRTYLSEKGISTDRLVSKGYGEGKPVASNDTQEGQALNRRVEFTILQ
ncbi:MAG: OmpA family protein, partial [Bacteroidota bacterium]